MRAAGSGWPWSRELIGLHGGTITVDSAPQRGTTFRVLLPLGHDHLPSDRVAPTSTERGLAAVEPFVAEALRWLPDDEPEQPAAPVGAGQGRVLVADDNADMREYLARLLRPRYAVRVVSDGAAALAAIREEPPDLVVSDVMMPGLDGMELLAAVRADPRTARIPVLLLSARAGQEAAVEGLTAGADDYLVKPFSAAELLARVGAHLQLGRARREAEARFTAIADLAPALIWVAGRSGARVFVNAGWRQFTGRAPDEPGADWQEGLHPQDRARYRETVAAAMAAYRGWEVEFRLRRADGVYRWLLERAVPIGPTEGWVGSCTDINARYRESERQTLLARFGAGLESEPGPAAQVARLARLVTDARLADLCCVLRIDDDGRLRPDGIAAVDADAEAAVAGIHPESPTVREVVTTGRPRLIADVPEVGSPEWSAADVAPDQLALYRRIAVRSALLLPLSARGRVLGVLALLRRGDSPRYDDDDRALMEEVAGRAAAALDNALLLAEERATAARLAVLQRATAELSAAVTPAEVGAAAVAHLARLVGDFSTVGVYEIDGPGAALLPLALEKIDDTAKPRLTSVPLQSPLVVAEAVREQRPLWVDDVEAPEWAVPHPGWADVLGGLGIRGVIALPLIAGGRAVGVMGVGFRVPLRECAIERATLTALAEQCAQAMDRARLYRAEHRVAETLQRSLLPQRLPQLPRLALDARYLPGAEGVQAGGDWYDVIELDEHRVAIAVGDVVGQGAAAAAVMGQLRSALAAALLQGHGPAAALELLDRFAARVPGTRASTAACLTLDWAAGLVCWARAGHPPALLADSAGVRLLDGDGHGPVLGLTGRAPYSEGVTGLEAGATLVLYTDGLVERRGEVIDEGLDRLADAVRRHAGSLPVALVPAVLDDLAEHGHAADDIAVIAARLMPGPAAPAPAGGSGPAGRGAPDGPALGGLRRARRRPVRRPAPRDGRGRGERGRARVPRRRVRRLVLRGRAPRRRVAGGGRAGLGVVAAAARGPGVPRPGCRVRATPGRRGVVRARRDGHDGALPPGGAGGRPGAGWCSGGGIGTGVRRAGGRGAGRAGPGDGRGRPSGPVRAGGGASRRWTADARPAADDLPAECGDRPAPRGPRARAGPRRRPADPHGADRFARPGLRARGAGHARHRCREGVTVHQVLPRRHPVRRPFLGEGGHALLALGRGEVARRELLHRGEHSIEFGTLHQGLRRGQCARRAQPEQLDVAGHLGVEPVGGHGGVDEADGHSAPRVERLAGEEQLVGGAGEQPGEHGDGDDRGDHADADLGEGEGGGVDGHGDVAGREQPDPPGAGRAGDPGHHRLGRGQDRAQDRGELRDALRAAGAAGLPQVHAGAEDRTGVAQDDHPDGRVGDRRVEVVLQLAAELRGQGVAVAR